MSPQDLVDQAEARGAEVLVASFNEPMIAAEWVREIFREARKRGLVTALVSNGHGTPEVLEYLLPWVDLMKIDLKAFRERTYLALGGNLIPVLETLKAVAASPVWLEVVTVLVPGMNDSLAEVGEMAAFLAGVNLEIPWHLHGFRPDYHATHLKATPYATLARAADQARKAGLHHVYPGLVSGLPSGVEDTDCPGCGELVIRRREAFLREVRLAKGTCPGCGRAISGRW
jgi:pyruvate formate lyase activating enzyme